MNIKQNNQEKYLQKKKQKKSANDFFIAVLLHFYDQKYINSTKSRLSNQKSGTPVRIGSK